MIPVNDAKISVYDIGLLRGFGIYEAMTTFNRKPFMLAEHLLRFHRSAAGMKIEIPLSDKEIEKAIKELVAHNVEKGAEAVIRIVLTGGEAIAGIEYDTKKPTFLILVEPLRQIDPKYYAQGCALMVHEFPRQFPQWKTTNYIQAVLLQEERKSEGALEILYTSNGNVLECATSNFFIVADGALITAADGVLRGITRAVVLDLGKDNEIQIEEREISTDEMYSADEAFLTSSFKGIVPVVAIGGKKIGNGTVGRATKRLMTLFDTFTSNY